MYNTIDNRSPEIIEKYKKAEVFAKNGVEKYLKQKKPKYKWVLISCVCDKKTWCSEEGKTYFRVFTILSKNSCRPAGHVNTLYDALHHDYLFLSIVSTKVNVTFYKNTKNIPKNFRPDSDNVICMCCYPDFNKKPSTTELD